jgi:hypothetical protein
MRQSRKYGGLALAACIGLSAVGCGNKSTATTTCPGFSRIVSGSFARSGHHLKWTYELESIPTELNLNRPAVPDGMVDYGWQINVDVDSDGQYDHDLSIMHYKEPGAVESDTPDILGSTEHKIWKFSGDTAQSIGTFQAGISGNAFTFDVDDTAVPDLTSVTTVSQSYWTLAYRYGGQIEVCTDKWP